MNAMRIRDIKRWSPGIQYSDPEEFCRELDHDGFHTIQLNSTTLDLMLVDRKSETTLVAFQGSVPGRSTYPSFLGLELSELAGVNLIAISDPTVVVDRELRVGWYLGNRVTGPLKRSLLPVLRRSVDYLEGDRTIFYGESDGGYAAMNFGQHFSGAIALTINARLGFSDKPHLELAEYVNRAHKVKGRTPYLRVRDSYAKNLWETIDLNAPFYPVMYQNSGDAKCLETNHSVFVKQRSNDLDLAERLDFDGDGEVPIPRDKLLSILSALRDPGVGAEEAIRQAGFQNSQNRGDRTPVRNKVPCATPNAQRERRVRLEDIDPTVNPNKGVPRNIRLKRWPGEMRRRVTIPETYTRHGDGSLLPGATSVTTDAAGFILSGPSGLDSRRPIVFLGDSVVESLYAPEGQRWPDVVEDELEVRAPGSFRVLNGGKSGATLLHLALSLLATIPPYSGSLAGLFVIAPGADAKLELDTATYWSSHRFVDPLTPGVRKAGAFAYPEIGRDRDLLWRVIFETMSAYDIPGAVLSAPVRCGEWSKSKFLQKRYSSRQEYDASLHRYDEVKEDARKAAAKGRVDFFWNYQSMPRENNERFFYDHVHFNDLGHRTFGKEVADAIWPILRRKIED